VVAGRYYLIAFSLKTSTKNMPVLMSTYSEPGLRAVQITNTIINTAMPISPNYPALTNVYKSIGTYLYGGYCTESNPNWGLTVTFGRCDYSSFAYSIDEMQGADASPIVSSSAVKNNQASALSDAPAYLVGVSMVPNENYPMVINPGWTQLSRCHDQGIVPNLITGYSLSGSAPGWTISTSGGQPGPYLEKALITCEIFPSLTIWDLGATTWDNTTIWY
jgi:hypothetical protein